MTDSLPWGAVPFPAGDNDTDTEIGGSHFNRTALEEWNYSFFSNRTLSNGSSCVLVFDKFTPAYVFPNGSFVNKTNCWQPLNHIGPRAKTGIGFAVPFCLVLLLTLACLRKHGKRYLPVEKRFFPISRRWQWYWGIWACAMALVSLFTNVDVDRYYVIEIPIILTSFFWYLMQHGILAVVWEAVRHWGSWQERQMVDPDPFALRQDDRRSKVEFWLPLWFYMWLWINFFLVIPRNWGSIKLQRSPEQVLLQAEPTATDVRFKAGAFCLIVCWLTIVASLLHSLQHYKQKRPTVPGCVVGFFRDVPVRFFIIVSLALFVVGFQIAVSFHFDISPLKVDGIVPAIYAGGYLPTLLVLTAQCVYGFMHPNEDRELRRQRRVRGEEMNLELGIVHKPSWWRRLAGHHQPKDIKDIIAKNAREVAGKRTTVEQGMDNSGADGGGMPMELTNLTQGDGAPSSDRQPSQPVRVSRPEVLSVYSGKSERRRVERARQHAATLLFPNNRARGRDCEAGFMANGPPPPYEENVHQQSSSGSCGRSEQEGGAHGSDSLSRESGATDEPPQRIRSMLDV